MQKLTGRQALWLAALYALALVVLTWPAARDLTDRVVGNNIDTWIFYWNNWWLGKALSEGHSWLSTPYLFFPLGSSLVTHSNSLTSSFIALLLGPLGGPVAAYNLTFLLGLLASALGMFLLVQDLTGHWPAAALAGLALSMGPYHISRALAQANLGSIQWWPFYALALRRAIKQGSRGYAALTGLLFALVLYSGIQLAIMIGLWTGLYLAWRALIRDKDARRPQEIALQLAIAAGVALILTIPVTLPAFEQRSQVEHAALDYDEGLRTQTDLLAYLLPAPTNPLLGALVQPFYQRFEVNQAFHPYLGYSVLLLALVGLFRQPSRAGLWLLGGALAALLAAGSAPRINGLVYSEIQLPYRSLSRLFPFSLMRSPDRYNLLLLFCMVVAAGFGAKEVYTRRRRLGLILSCLVVLEYLVLPLPMWELPSSSPVLEDLAADEPNYAVVNLPLGYSASKLLLYYQTILQRPILEGHLSRYSEASYAFITDQPLLMALYPPDDRPPRIDPARMELDGRPALGPGVRHLTDAGFRYVIVYKALMDEDDWERLGRYLPFRPVAEDDVVQIFDLADPLPYHVGEFPAILTESAELVRFDIQPESGSAKWRLQLMARLANPTASSLNCTLHLASAEAVAAAWELTFFDQLDGRREWQAGDLDLAEVEVTLPERLGTGPFSWSLSCNQALPFVAPDRIMLLPDGQVISARRILDLQYQDGIQLVAYSLRDQGSTLILHLNWLATQTPERNYKVFVHLLDRQGQIASQYDAIPCSWDCPTDQWAPGQRIQDQAVISLAGLSPGDYQLAVGLYDAETGDRLALDSPHADAPQGRLVLPDPLTTRQDRAP